MKLTTQRWVDFWIGQPVCAVLSCWDWLFRKIVPSKPLTIQPRNILIIMLSEMGSIVLAGPMFASIRLRFPSANIHMLQLKKNHEVSKILSFTDSSYLHTIDDKSLFSFLIDVIKISWYMRRLPVDTVVDCELFSRISSILSYLTGARLRVGFTPHSMEGLYRGNYINCSIPYNPYRHISLQFLSLIDALSISTDKILNSNFGRSSPLNKSSVINQIPQDCELRVTFTPQELSAYKSQLLNDYPQLTERKIILIYASGGILAERAWPIEYYSFIVKALCNANYGVGLIGLSDDSELANQLQLEAGSYLCANLTGYTRNIRELLLLFHCSQLLVTNDGGPVHFASLTPIDIKVFFGPETARLYGPLSGINSGNVQIFESGLACSPCLSAYNHRKTFCDGDNQCLKIISPELVLTEIFQTLQGKDAFYVNNS